MYDKEVAEKHKVEGNEFLADEEYESAIECFSKAIEANPENYVYFSNRSACHLFLKHYKDALADATECTKLNPGFLKGWQRKATAEFQLKNYEEAVQSYEKGLELFPKDKNLLTGLEAAKNSLPQLKVKQAKRKQPGEQRAPDVEQTLIQNPVTAQDFRENGNLFYKARKFEEALKSYDASIEKMPDDISVYNNKAAVFYERGQYEEAIELLEKVLERRYEMNSNQKDGASFEKVAKVYRRIATCYQKQEKFDEAIDAYKKSLLEDNTRFTRTALRELEKLKLAKERDKLINPELAAARKAEGNELFKAGQYADAKKLYDQAIIHGPNTAALYSNRAAAFTKLLAYPDALRDLDECIRLDPNFVKAYSRKGLVYYNMKDYNNALKAYESGLRIDPKNTECYQGRVSVQQAIQKTATSKDVDEDQLRHAMADPEIQQILKDPEINMFLKEMQENPQSAQEGMLKNPKLANAVNKLMTSGILRVQ